MMKLNKSFILSLIKRFLMEIKKRRYHLKFIHSSAYIAPDNKYIDKSLVMEKLSFLGMQCIIGPNVVIKKYAMIGPQVAFVGDDHLFNNVGVPIIFSGRPEILRPTIIGQDVWIGRGATILAGSCIGDGSIIAAGSVVTRNIPANSIAAGVPAKVIKSRFKDAEAWDKHCELLDGDTFNVESRGKLNHYVAPWCHFASL